MPRIIWRIKRFDYELRGRRFHLLTDHKAAEETRTKERFGNDRVCKWIEKIQEYDFSVRYRKGGELVTTNAPSKLHEEETKERNWGKQVIGLMGKSIGGFALGW
jgi:hypothetical protein